MVCDAPLVQNGGTVLHTAVQSQKAVPAYFTSKQILPFGFAGQCNSSVHIPVIAPTGAICEI